MHLFVILSVDYLECTDSLDPFTAALTIPGGPKLLLTHLKWDCLVVVLHTDLSPVMGETLTSGVVRILLMLLQRQMADGQRLRVIWGHSLYWHKVAKGFEKERRSEAASGLWYLIHWLKSVRKALQCVRMLFLCHPGIARLARGRWDAGFAVVAVQRVRNSF